MGTETIPVVICALGVIKKGLEKYIEEIPGTVTIGELQKKYPSGGHLPSSERFSQPSELFGS